ncbi:MAG: septal ring lytic transglycosylase RlpA family protein [Desulfomonile sp.]
MKYCQYIVITVFIIGMFGCGTKVAMVKQESSRSYTIKGKTYTPLKIVSPGHFQKGVASWYGPGFHGKKTSSGEVYDMHGLTAAHNILPLNTVVKVTNLANQREVVVRINDRGPFVDDRVIDLSLTAAHKLGMVGPGTVPVQVAVIGAKDSGQTTRLASNEVKPQLVKAPNPFYTQAGPRLLALTRN